MMNKISWPARFCTLLLWLSMTGCMSPPAPEMMYRAGSDDGAVTARVKTEIIADPDLQSSQITVETHQGTVELNGFVTSDQAVDKAEALARSVKGVKAVINNLVVKGSG